MQLNGIGSNHSTDMHQVTNCMHNHDVSEKKGGAAMKVQNTATKQQTLEQSLESGMSLTDWVKNMLNGAKGLWGKVWGDSAGDVTSGEGDSPTYSVNMGETSHVAQASAAVQPVQTLENNPYFSAVQDTGRQQETLWQKVKVRFQNIAGYLTKHFSFSNRDTFHAKQEKPKEDLSRRSRYRKDELEIDCVLTDESYLMDSYNKKGEYSTLSADNNREGNKSNTE